MHMVLVDIKAAYYSFEREELFRAMGGLGLGGDEHKLFASLNNDDYVRFDMMGKLTKKMFISQRLKQGCLTSPLAYDIFKKAICDKLGCSTSPLV